MKTIALLTISNAFMNLAWYGHLKFKDQPLWIVILASWFIAIFRIHLSSTGQSHRFQSVDGAAAQNSAGMHHADCLHRCRVRAFSLTRAMELPRFLRIHRRCGLLCF
jgi:Putative member of DMT superfamily (DUF486)